MLSYCCTLCIFLTLLYASYFLLLNPSQISANIHLEVSPTCLSRLPDFFILPAHKKVAIEKPRQEPSHHHMHLSDWPASWAERELGLVAELCYLSACLSIVRSSPLFWNYSPHVEEGSCDSSGDGGKVMM
jgi:hypothetical protein